MILNGRCINLSMLSRTSSSPRRRALLQVLSLLRTINHIRIPNCPMATMALLRSQCTQCNSTSSGYGPSFQQSNLLHSYVPSQQGAVQSQARPQIQQSFQSGSQPYPYTQAFRADDQTISPHVLERVDNIPQSQRSAQTWNQGVAAGYEHQNAINSIGAHSQQTSSRPKTGEYTSPSFGGVGDSGGPGGIPSQAREVPRTAVSRRGTTILPQSTLRITHPELLAATQNIPSRRINSAPFIVLDEVPVELEGGVKGRQPRSHCFVRLLSLLNLKLNMFYSEKSHIQTSKR